MSRKLRFSLVLAGLAIGLAGCGYSPGDRAVSGGLIGAGTGAVIGSTVGAPLAGAAIGGTVGAVGGAATTGSGVNLGKPIWR